MSGPKKGLRTLPETEDLARELFKALDDDQRALAYRKEKFPEPQQATPAPKLGKPVGLPAAKMTPKQRDLLMKLVTSYANRMPPEVADAELTEIRKAGVENIHFAYNGGTDPGKPYTYRVHGPTFVIEFLNTQNDSAGNPANHIHSAWRRIQGDFGLSAK
jgi:hypothetical protein